jgi:membrane protein involved in colicin uptake
MAVGIIGGVANSYSMAKQGADARRQAEWEAGQMEIQAAHERDSGNQRAAKIRRNAAAARSAAVAQTAASGVKVGEGSALEAERQILTTSEEDAFLSVLTADRRERQLKDVAQRTRKAGKATYYNAWLSAFGSFFMSSSSWMGTGSSGGGAKQGVNMGSAGSGDINSGGWA